MSVSVTHFSDPGCPWAWSASPALAALHWRYGDQLTWRHVMIGLAEDASQYEQRGYTPLWMARSQTWFRRYGMPFNPQPKARVAATSRACRAVISVRLRQPELVWAAFRALQLMQFCSPGLLDDDADLRAALEGVDGLDASAVVRSLDDSEVLAAYERDRSTARSAAGTPTEAQGKSAATDGPVRYTAPSLVFKTSGRRLEAGGFQPLAVYDVLLANLDPSLDRRPVPEDLCELFDAFPFGLVTAEVAAILAGSNDQPDLQAAEEQLLGLVADGHAVRTPVGDGALWQRADRAVALRPVVERAAGGRFGVRTAVPLLD